MKLPRFLTTRLASALALGCALLVSAPLAHAQVKQIRLTDDGLNKALAAAQALAKDPAAKAEYVTMSGKVEVISAVENLTNIPDDMLAQFPKAVAAFRSAGTTADEFFRFGTALSLKGIAFTNTEIAAVSKANQEFYDANKEKMREFETAQAALAN